MARLSDQELQELKLRATNAALSGTRIANAEERLVDLITEVQEHRSAKAAPAAKATLQVGEMTVAKTEPAPAPTPEEKLETLREALKEGENSPIVEDYSLEKVLDKVSKAAEEPAEEPAPAPKPEKAPIKDEPTKSAKRSKK